MLTNAIVYNTDSFIINDFSQERLLRIGSLFILRFFSALNGTEIPDVTMEKYQKKASVVLKKKIFSNMEWELEVLIAKNRLSLHGEYTLYITVHDQDHFLEAKRILSDIIT